MAISPILSLWIETENQQPKRWKRKKAKGMKSLKKHTIFMSEIGTYKFFEYHSIFLHLFYCWVHYEIVWNLYMYLVLAGCCTSIVNIHCSIAQHTHNIQVLARHKISTLPLPLFNGATITTGLAFIITFHIILLIFQVLAYAVSSFTSIFSAAVRVRVRTWLVVHFLTCSIVGEGKYAL